MAPFVWHRRTQGNAWQRHVQNVFNPVEGGNASGLPAEWKGWASDEEHHRERVQQTSARSWAERLANHVCRKPFPYLWAFKKRELFSRAAAGRT